MKIVKIITWKIITSLDNINKLFVFKLCLKPTTALNVLRTWIRIYDTEIRSQISISKLKLTHLNILKIFIVVNLGLPSHDFYSFLREFFTVFGNENKFSEKVESTNFLFYGFQEADTLKRRTRALSQCISRLKATSTSTQLSLSNICIISSVRAYFSSHNFFELFYRKESPEDITENELKNIYWNLHCPCNFVYSSKWSIRR